MHAADILTEDLALPDDPDDLEATFRGLCHLPDVKGSKRRRIDFLTVPWTARGAALLYYTVSDLLLRPRIIIEVFSGRRHCGFVTPPQTIDFHVCFIVQPGHTSEGERSWLLSKPEGVIRKHSS